ncbi:hypothetical protein [Sphingobacterium tabacisoli]|uniref:Polysaccharide lyase family 7 protein n=1 Tax=Sphingobacterium tabacisoli TaxID=2044855 RepID=A0ABW5KVG5_9SPHI|nr:hypothetical protein [Sphingobacterium tabacisoli]
MKSLLFAVTIGFCISCAPAKKMEVVKPELPQESSKYFPNEVKPAASKPCFQGAYYRKLVSSVDHWVGISGTAVLPQITFDQTRKNPKKEQQFLDNPSIYLGGHVDGQETDIGLSWEVIKDEKGNISDARVAFRPFLRRASHKSGQQAVFLNGPATKDYYWYPGEEVFMSIETVGKGLVKFVIEGAGKKYETTFECAGYTLDGLGEFKRVNAIDQMGNEGKPVQPTTTKVSMGKWLHTDLLRYEKGKVVKTPFHDGRYTEMNCPQQQFFKVDASVDEKSKGAEVVHISGSGF